MSSALIKENFARLTPEEQREALEKQPPEQLLEMRQYLEQLTPDYSAEPPKRRRRK